MRSRMTISVGMAPAVCLAVAGYLLANPLGALAVSSISGIPCASSLMLVTCAYPGDSAMNPDAALAFAASLLVAVGASFLWLRNTIAFPFVVTLSALAGFTLGFDSLFARPILDEARLVNDTMNVLSFVLLGSFVMMFALLRSTRPALLDVGAAVALTFAVKIVAMCVFALLLDDIMGTFELFVLFAVYAFGAFSVHTMILSFLLRTANAPVATAPQTRNNGILANPVDGLRGLAIVLVVIYHYIPAHFFSFSLGKPINAVLFVVAGYFFAATLLRKDRALNGASRTRATTAASLLAHRHIRIWPMLAIVVGLYMLLSVLDPSPLTQQINAMWGYYLAYLGYVPKWLYEGEAFPSHLWVIGAQEGLILAICIGVLFAGLDNVRRWLWVLIAAGVVVRFLGILAFMPDHTALALDTPLAVLDALALGMVARFQLADPGTAPRLRALLRYSLIATVAVWMILPNWNATYFTLVPFAVALATTLLLVVASDDVRGARLSTGILVNPALVFLGRMSLSAFLLHPFVNTVLRLVYTRNTGEEMAWWALFAVGPVASFAVAYVFWRLIEEPLRKLRTRSQDRADRIPIAGNA